MFRSAILLVLLFMAGAVEAAPVISMGAADDYCVVYCYIRVQYTITGYDSPKNIGMVYCDVDAEATSTMGTDSGETRTKHMHESPIGVFKNTGREIKGAVEFDTGISMMNFRGSRVKSAKCHI